MTLSTIFLFSTHLFFVQTDSLKFTFSSSCVKEDSENHSLEILLCIKNEASDTLFYPFMGFYSKLNCNEIEHQTEGFVSINSSSNIGFINIGHIVAGNKYNDVIIDSIISIPPDDSLFIKYTGIKYQINKLKRKSYLDIAEVLLLNNSCINQKRNTFNDMVENCILFKPRFSLIIKNEKIYRIKKETRFFNYWHVIDPQNRLIVK